MAGEIINKVAEANIQQIDLASFKSNTNWMEIDLKEQLWNELVLKEKDFRKWVKETDWSVYENQFVFIHCSNNAIIPAWAFMLITVQLEGAAYIHCGNKASAEEAIFFKNLADWDIDHLKDQRVMVKGCSDIPKPNKAYIELTNKLVPTVKSLMFGEPCSAVPVYKKKA